MAVLSLLAMKASAQGGLTATLAWDTSISADVAGYNIYYGTRSGVYTNSLSVDAYTTSTQISGLNAGTTYFFAVTAVDSASDESDFSPETYFSTPVPPKLLTQTWSDPDGNPYLEITTAQAIPRFWVLEYSLDLADWYAFDYGYGSAVDEVMPANNEYFPQLFFRLAIF